jgi:hypothetical protein
MLSGQNRTRPLAQEPGAEQRGAQQREACRLRHRIGRDGERMQKDVAPPWRHPETAGNGGAGTFHGIVLSGIVVDYLA